MFERSKSLKGNNQARIEPASYDERNSARMVNNSSGKTATNSGKVNYKKLYISKVPLRKQNSEAVLKTDDIVGGKSTTSATNTSKSHYPITPANDSNGINSQNDTRIEFGLLNAKENVSNIKNIFYREAESENHLENAHLLVDVIKELRNIEKTLSKSKSSSLKNHFYLNRAEIAKEKYTSKHIIQNTDHSAEFYSYDGISTVIRPSTVPKRSSRVSDARLTNKSYSNPKFTHESDFFSKIPIRTNREIKNQQPNLQIEINDCRVGSFIREKSKLSLRKKWNILPTPKRRQYCSGKKYNYRRQGNGLKEHIPQSQSEYEIETALSQLQQDIKKQLPKTFAKTISSLELDSQIRFDKNTANNRNLPRFASKIPIGVKSSVGIVRSPVKSKSLKNLQATSIKQEQNTLNELDNLQSNEVSKYQVMAVSNLINPGVAKLFENKKNKSTDRARCTCNIKRIEVINDRALETKRGCMNISKLNSQFCSGDKRKNSKILLQPQPLRKLLRENENKLKLRKPCMSRNASSNKEFDLKSILSTPDTRIRKSTQKVVKSKVATECSTPNVLPVDKSSICGTIRAPQCKTKSFSDTNFLKINSGNYAKMLYCDERNKNSTRQEKSIQTLTNTNTIEVQANVTLNNSYAKGNDIQLDVKPTDSFGVIWDYCTKLLKTNQTLEQQLKEYRAKECFFATDIGCQVDTFTSIDSDSQTAYCSTDKSCQYYAEKQSISYRWTQLNSDNNIVPNSHIGDVFKQYNLFENIQHNPPVFLTLSECSLGLGRNNLRRTMSCYCKEGEERNKAQDPREKYLYDDEYDDDEYSECYMKELLFPDLIVEENPCGSTPSLPEVVSGLDRCESKIEIPWLKISLPPPGYYEIKTMPGRPKQVVCDCWALSTGDDVYNVPVDQVKTEQECTCKYAQGGKPVSVTEEKQTVKPALAKSQSKTPAPPISQKSLNFYRAEEIKQEEQAQEEEKPPVEEEQPPQEEEQAPQEEEQPPPEEDQPPPEEEQYPIEEPTPPQEVPEEKPQPPSEETPGGGGGGGGGEETTGKPSNQVDEDSSSSSIPSTCTCLHKDECADMIGRPTDFVYENACYGYHETYLDPIYKLFPDDCDTYCGPYIEMPWSQLTIPRNIKLRTAKKVTKDDKDCTCEKKDSKQQSERDGTKEEEKEIIVCGNKDEVKDTSAKISQTPSENPPEKNDKSFEIQLSFTEILGNIKKVDDPMVPSSSACHCRLQSPRGKAPPLEICPERSNYSCRCSGSKSPSSPKPKSPKCKNSNCKLMSSSVRIDPNPSYNQEYKQKYNSVPRTPVQNSQRPSKKGHYQDQVMNVLETCEAEMEPLRDTLNQLKSKIRNLNIPELNNWNNGTSSPCPACPPRSMTAYAGMQPPAPPLPQYQFPPVFSGMSAQLPQIPPTQRPRTCCCGVRDRRSRRKTPRSASSGSTELSEFDSLSDGESPCPFLRALSSKNIYKEKDSRAQRKLRAHDGNKYDRHCKKPTCSARRNNKKNQADYSRQDNYTDTEPEIQVHYGPKRPRMKTKQMFKSVIDPNLIATKNQRLRIAVKVTPSDAEPSNDKLLAIQGPYESTKSTHCSGSGCKRSK